MKDWFKIWPFAVSRKKNATILYEKIISQSRSKYFYELLGIPDTVDGRFELMVLHAFLVIRRLKGDKKKLKFGRDIMTFLFDDFDLSLREVGVGDMGIGKKIKLMADSFYGRIFAYEEALKDEGDLLEQALNRNVFRNKINNESTRILADYIRREAFSIEKISDSDLLDARLNFGPAPKIELF